MKKDAWKEKTKDMLAWLRTVISSKASKGKLQADVLIVQLVSFTHTE